MRSRALEVYQQRKTEIRLVKFKPQDVKGKHNNASFVEIVEDRVAVAKCLRSFRDEVQHLNWWKDRFNDRAARSIVASDIEEAKQELSEGRKPSTVNRYLAALNTAFSLAVHNRKADHNPVKEVKLFREKNDRVRYLIDVEESRLFAVILKPEDKDLITIAFNTRMRKSEEFSLQWPKVDFRLRQILVKDSKPGNSRIIPMNDAVFEVLLRRSKLRLIDNPFVFPGRKPTKCRKDLPYGWEKFLKQASIENFHWHDLRHTFASRLVMAGVDLYTVCKLLGHADIKMTMRYAHLSPGYLKAPVDVLNRNDD